MSFKPAGVLGSCLQNKQANEIMTGGKKGKEGGKVGRRKGGREEERKERRTDRQTDDDHG